MTFFKNSFIPSANIIITISNTNPAIVTTLSSHGYDDGLYVRLIVPKNCGMQQINDLTRQISILTPNTFSFPVNALNFDSFAYTSIDQIAQVIPVGEIDFSLTQAVKNANNITPEY